MKKGSIEQKVLFILFELVLVLMVGAALFAYVKTSAGNSMFIYDVLARDTGLSLSVLAFAPGQTSMQLVERPFLKPTFLEVSQGAVKIFLDKNHQRSFYYLAPIELKSLSFSPMEYNSSKVMSKGSTLSFGTMARIDCTPAGFVIPEQMDFSKEVLIRNAGSEQIRVQFIHQPVENPSVYIISPPSKKTVLCTAEQSDERVAVAYVDQATEISATIYAQNKDVAATTLRQVFS